MNFKIKQKGFTFVEIIVAVFIFTLMMLTVARMFSSSVSFYRETKNMQKDLETVQFAINQIAKTLRQSSVIVDTTSEDNDIVIFDYATESCLKYIFTENNIKLGKADTPLVGDSDRGDFERDPITWCQSRVPSTLDPMVNSDLNIRGKFFYFPSDKAGVLGKVTISTAICKNVACINADSHKFNIQTTVSLRDYYNSGI